MGQSPTIRESISYSIIPGRLRSILAFTKLRNNLQSWQVNSSLLGGTVGQPMGSKTQPNP